MNSFIETLKHWGTNFAGFAWPMIWQSSMLIAVLLAVDLALRRKVRASARYALWLVVLVKLCLPPTLALPTSPAWWMHGTPPPAVESPVRHYTVTYGDAPSEPMPVARPLPVMPKPKLTSVAWLLTACMGVSAILLAWLLVRWWQVVRRVRSAERSLRLTALCREVQKSLGMRSAVRVKIAPNMTSPAVCGLFRPAILIPRVLCDNFSAEQLKAVLLHELIHLRRLDVWVNFAQSLLQIFYWWHPLVWVANGRIRQVREEAVDDAVMVALNEGADAYAPTLLEVARLALNRPMASLGLVGILESRRALRQRIERLMDFRPPRRAGLTVASFLGIVAFTAVAVPMGQAPEKDESTGMAATVTAESSTNSEAVDRAEAVETTTNEQILIEAVIYELTPEQMNQGSWEFESMHYDTATRSMLGTIASSQMEAFQTKIEARGAKTLSRPRIQTLSSRPAEFFMGETDNQGSGLDVTCLPVVRDGKVDLSLEVRKVKTNGEVTQTNQMSGHTTVENRGGVFMAEGDGDGAKKNKLVALVKVELVKTGLRYQSVLRPAEGSTTASQEHVAERLQANIHRADGSDSNSKLATRTYKVDVRSFKSALPGGQGLSNSAAYTAAARKFFSSVGVDLKSPVEGIYLNDQNGILLVRATETDLDTVEKAVEVLNNPVVQIHIKARFFEVPEGMFSGFNQFLLSSNNLADGMIGILTPDNARATIKALESRKDVKQMAEPEVVTTSGRQTQMRATQVLTLVTNAGLDVMTTNGSHMSAITFQTGTREFGPMFDVIATVLGDGYTITLDSRATVSEFFGYSDIPKKLATHTITNSFGEAISVPSIWPAVQARYGSALVNLFDNQTMLLTSWANPEEELFAPPDKARGKRPWPSVYRGRGEKARWRERGGGACDSDAGGSGGKSHTCGRGYAIFQSRERRCRRIGNQEGRGSIKMTKFE